MFPQRLVALNLLAVLAFISLVGCAGQSSHMKDVAAQDATYAPTPGNALVIFMRPSGLGFAVQSSVFDVTSGEPEMVGIVSAKTKVAYEAQPGEHRFMVIGESADFMGADLLAGNTYYALVTPRMGVWKARFSLKPVSKAELGTDQFTDWYDECRWVENTPQSSQWMADHIQSIKEKQTEYFAKWKEKPDKPHLLRSDGI